MWRAITSLSWLNDSYRKVGVTTLCYTLIENAWRGAEGYHFFILAQRQLQEGRGYCPLLYTDREHMARVITSLSWLKDSYRKVRVTALCYTLIENAWCGAEGYHFFILAQRQLQEGRGYCPLLYTDGERGAEGYHFFILAQRQLQEGRGYCPLLYTDGERGAEGYHFFILAQRQLQGGRGTCSLLQNACKPTVTSCLVAQTYILKLLSLNQVVFHHEWVCFCCHLFTIVLFSRNSQGWSFHDLKMP